MRTQIVFLALMVVFGFFSQASGKSITAQWTGYENDPAYLGYYIYVSPVAETCIDDSYFMDVTDPALREITFELDEGIHFAHIIPYSTENIIVTDRSLQCVVNIIGDMYTHGQIHYTADEHGVDLSWDELPGVEMYTIAYSGAQSGTVRLQTNSHRLNLPLGDYHIKVAPLDFQGYKMQTYQLLDYYEAVDVTVALPPLPPPDVRLETIGNTPTNQKIVVAAQSSDSRVSGYNVYISDSFAAAANRTGEIFTGMFLLGENFCQTINATGKEIIFAAVTAYDSSTGAESLPTIKAKLFGNIVDSVDDPYYQNMKVDGADMQALQTNYFKQVLHRSTDLCSDPNLFNLLPLTTAERSDYNASGIVNGADLNWLRFNYYHSGAEY